MAIGKRIRFEIFKRDCFTCQYCGAKPPDTVLEVDHVQPKCQGGTDAMHNLKTACWNCNRGKAGIPMTPLNEYKTTGGGPLDGTVLRLSKYYASPFVWVMTDDIDEIVLFEDERVDCDETGRRLRWGHPGFKFPQQFTERPNWFLHSDHNGLNPRVFGAYVSEATDEEPTVSLAWYTPERIILELTA